MNRRVLCTLGISIWWSEGTKSRKDKRWKNARSYPIEVTNTNPQIIIVFLQFLREVIVVPEDKLTVQIQIHQGDDKMELERYWSTVTGIPLSHFNKTIVRPQGKKIGKSLGTCKIRFADKAIYTLLENLLSRELKKIGVGTHGILTSGKRDINLLK